MTAQASNDRARHVRQRLAQRLRRGVLLGAIGALAAGYWVASRSRPADAIADSTPPATLPPGRTLRVPGRGEMFFRETPGPRTDAPTVALLHGWMFPGDLHFAQVAPALNDHARVIVPDHRGHGRGARPAAPFRLVDVADDVAELLRRTDAGPAVLVGYSLGGPVALLTWQRHPDLVRGLVLCATSATFAEDRLHRLAWRLMGALQLGLRLLPRHYLEALLLRQTEGRLPFPITRMIHEDTPPEAVERLPWFVGEFDRDSPEDVAEAGRELGRFDARGWVPTIDVPTAVVVTTRDRLVPPRLQRGLAALVPDALVRELDADHDVIVADPQWLGEAISAVMEDLGLV